MSGTLDLATMVADIKSRVPIGLSDDYVKARLNQSFRWIAEQESFVWNLRRVPVAVDPDTVDFPLPSDADPGDVMSLYGEDFKSEIPFIPFQRFSQQQVWNQPPPGGNFSAWTFINTGDVYMAKLAPDTALVAAVTLNLFYHATAEAVTDDVLFFPSPDEFDDTILDLTEAEIKRRYYIAGWEAVQQKAVESVKKLIDVYSSSKTIIQGLADQAKRAQEAAAKRAE